MSIKSLIPTLPAPTLASTRAQPTEQKLARFDAVLLIHNATQIGNTNLPASKLLGRVAERVDDPTTLSATLPGSNATSLVAVRVSDHDDAFASGEKIRKATTTLLAAGARQIAVVLDHERLTDSPAAARAAVTALCLADFVMPKFASKKPAKRATQKITVFEPKKTDQKQALATARGNCLARWLTAMPPNLLDAVGYRAVVETLAKRYRWQYRFLSTAALKRRGAGAFVAVAQGNEHNEAGIVQLRTRRAKGRKRDSVALVGKGIIFDTGGTNLKPFDGMLGMHVDMGGSAVVMGTLLALTEMDADVDVDAWLAITENRTGPDAYKPQDVITALNGKTIQTIHTDAEGRMVLADTLTLAAKEKPGCILDFATLTGASVNAVTTRYSSVYTNRPALHTTLIEHGVTCGERVWPFPIGGEFKADLKSETADIKQCSPGGGGDHILAATFLAEFVPESVPWVHMDLSSCERKGGLGVVPTDITGFGVAYATSLITDARKDIIRAKSGV